MPKMVVNGPSFEQKYNRRMGFRGLNVINGAQPNGHLPRVVGSGIFSGEQRTDKTANGIFYNDDARFDYEVEQPDMKWTLLRRPGVPLYPGSSARGIVLVGPSMGMIEPGEGTGALMRLGAAAAVGFGIAALAMALKDRYDR